MGRGWGTDFIVAGCGGQRRAIETARRVSAPQDAELGELVAEASADADTDAAFGAAAAEDGGAGLGLHAGAEAVDFGAVAAVRLERTLGHSGLSLRQTFAANLLGLARLLDRDFGRLANRYLV